MLFSSSIGTNMWPRTVGFFNFAALPLWAISRREKLVKGHHVLVRAHVVLPPGQSSGCRVHESVVCEMDIQSRRLGVLPIPSEAGPGGLVRQGPVQEPCMCVVNGAFESLQPIALLPHLRQNDGNSPAPASIQIWATAEPFLEDPCRPGSLPPPPRLDTPSVELLCLKFVACGSFGISRQLPFVSYFHP